MAKKHKFGIIFAYRRGGENTLLPRVWSTRRELKSALTLRLLKSGKFYGSSGNAIGLICQFWADPVVRLPGLQSLSNLHGRATPGIKEC